MSILDKNSLKQPSQALNALALAVSHPRGAEHAVPHNADSSFLKLVRKMDEQVIFWLPDAVVLDLVDGISLIDQVSQGRLQAHLYDYSVLLAPLFKGLEGTLVALARGLGFTVDEPWKVGRALDEEKIRQYFQDVQDKLAQLDEDSRLDLQIWLTNAKSFLTVYRHNPAHHGNEPIVNVDRLEQKANTIVESINELIKRILDSGVIAKAGHATK